MRSRSLRSFPPLLALVGAALTLGGCDWTTPKVPGAAERSAKLKLDTAKRLRRACASSETYDRLKALIFDDVSKVRSGSPQLLDTLAANATMRMENPVAKSRDEQLDVTVCEGHLVLDLPPGVQDAFDGDRRLDADVEYSAQQAADGSGLVFAMRGAEPIVYRLAALTLPQGAGRAVGAPEAPVTATAEAPPVAAPSPPPRVAIAAPPQPPAARQPAPMSLPIPRRETPMPPRPQPQPKQPRPAEVAASPERAPAMARPSFSCERVSSRVLRMVCSSPDLAARDRRMSSAFYAALANGDERTRAVLRDSRDRFLRFRNRCATPACVAQAYDDRTAEIRDIASGR